MAEVNEAEEREDFFDRLDDMLDEMYELFGRHEALVEDYSRAMAYMETRDGWRAAYVQRVAGSDSVEGTGEIDD